ncbi:MAG: HYExAFE family protein [Phycisphaerae bacterium]
MANRAIHYEAAFEALLRDRGTPYVAVDEAKKALFADSKLKSFDFVGYSSGGPNLLIDVKGRQVRSANGKPQSPQTWVTVRDVEDLAAWEQVFGGGYVGLIAFCYWIDEPPAPGGHHFRFKDRWYETHGIRLSDYRNHMKLRSAKWQTVSIPTSDFRQLARPINDWL